MWRGFINTSTLQDKDCHNYANMGTYLFLLRIASNSWISLFWYALQVKQG